MRSVVFLFYVTVFVQPANAQSISIDSVITDKKLKEIVYEIADDSLQGRFINSAGCMKAANIIAKRMEAAGLRSLTEMNNYFQDLDGTFKYVRNVIGVLPGTSKKEEIIIISAHYDHLGFGSPMYRFYKRTDNPKRDSIFNGANDNASGIAVMLALAEYFASKPVERTLFFVAFSGGDAGFAGSYGLSATLNPDFVMAQINLKMLGRREASKRPMITGDWYDNLLSLLNRKLAESTGEMDYFRKDANDQHRYFRRSDNYPFAIRGVPAHTIQLGSDFDRLQHHEGDAPKTLDYKLMSIIAKNIAVAIEPLVQGKITPQRIDVRKILEDKKRFFNQF